MGPQYPDAGPPRQSYARGKQNLDLQLTAPQAAGAARIFAGGGVSGSTTERPHLSKALERLEVGDVFTVWKLDRLGRDTRHVPDVIENPISPCTPRLRPRWGVVPDPGSVPGLAFSEPSRKRG